MSVQKHSPLLFILCATGTIGSSMADRDWAGDATCVIKTGEIFLTTSSLFAARGAPVCLRSARSFPGQL